MNLLLRSLRTCVPAIVTFVAAASLRAQGTITLQGYGYPPGQLTTRAATTGGALGEFDQAAPLNPASLMNWGVGGGYFQYSPERRALTVNGTKSSNLVARFPVVSVGLPLGQRFAFGISSSTLLDRTYTTATSARQQIRTDSVTVNTVVSSRGNMNAVQFAGAMQVVKWLRAGAGIQIVTGENRFSTLRSIIPDTVARADTVSYDNVRETSTATFGGTALTFGVEVSPISKLSVAGSARLGFGMRADLNDSTRLTADVPNRVGLGVRWEVGGTNLAARYEWQGWSSMQGLARSARAFDTREYGVGAELPGPKLPGGQLLYRLGARQRTLPFGVGGVQPKESLVGGGFGLPIGFGRAQLDLGIERATRKVPGLNNIRESGTIMSFGFRLRT